MSEQSAPVKRNSGKNEHIREFLRYYYSLTQSPGYAVLLDGVWGSGKTWLVKDILDSLPSISTRKHFYVSLNGLSSTAGIDQEFFKQLHPYLSSPAAQLAKSVFLSGLRINLNLNSDDKNEGSLSGSSVKTDAFRLADPPKDSLLVFDDLERTAIPIPELFGHITQYVEHGGFKVVLLANETEMRPKDPELLLAYRRRREKLIAYTFQVQPEVQAALLHFSRELPSKAKDFVRAHLDTAERVYSLSRYQNLRLLKHSLWEFSRILESLELRLRKNEKLMADLFQLFLAYSFEVRSGNIDPSEVGNIPGGRISAIRDEKPNKYGEIQERYRDLHLYEELVAIEVWDALFTKGQIDSQGLSQSLGRSKYFHETTRPLWMNLWHWEDCSDEEFTQLLRAARTEWESCKEREVGAVLHLAGLFFEFAEAGLLDASPESILTEAKCYISSLRPQLAKLSADRTDTFLSRRAYNQLGFYSNGRPEFEELLTYAERERAIAIVESYPAEMQALLDLLSRDTALFRRRLTLSNDAENKFYKTPILHLVEATEFVKQTISLRADQLLELRSTIRGRYEIGSHFASLILELPWLEQVKVLLLTEIRSRSGRLSSYVLRQVVNEIESAIGNLRLTQTKQSPDTNPAPQD